MLNRLLIAALSAATAASAADRPASGEAPDPAALWSNIVARVRPLPQPLEWANKQPTQEELDRYHASNAVVVTKGATDARDFYTRYPDHPNAKDARRQEFEWLKITEQLGATNMSARLAEVRNEMARDPNVDARTRMIARWSELQPKLMQKQADGPAAFAAEIEKTADQLIKEFPGVADPYQLLNDAAQFYVQAKQYDRAVAVAKRLSSATDAPEQLRALGQLAATRYGYLGKPVAMKFTSVDGRVVDFEKLRGKVVFIDFWASWCGPCRVALPDIKKVYTELHGKGFEVIGVNLDTDKEGMNRVTHEFDLPWPVRYDGEGTDGKVGRQFGIAGIPSMWLLDKKGVVRNILEGVPRDGSLATQLREDVLKLLAEK